MGDGAIAAAAPSGKYRSSPPGNTDLHVEYGGAGGVIGPVVPRVTLQGSSPRNARVRFEPGGFDACSPCRTAIMSLSSPRLCGAWGPSMTEEQDVQRAAAYLVKEYGELASLRASLRAEWLRNAGNTGGYRTWSQVAAAVLELLATDKL